ncbi:uncharacterized protein A1O9_01682 [Exophiala aquamarina CBS 119918]|uniref:Glycosyltransferase family 28 N-terminal domain-containing protein n=1 Tax=Exophiala aquamarina CBS 119918 TaxID=1182545 RepID=A0A072PUD8_9EURO|nr:uncharacterized protein A1O9_01682 [Exophiala aquamarina CBS 119918]KEF63704.1 hypothetical protein A1O9_01682 [Exophiala aquamarina CBS 119918]
MAVHRRRILFFTNSDFGQANVVLASVYAMMHVATDLEIHIASFHPLEGAVRELSDKAVKQNPPKMEQERVIFHGIDGLSQFDAAKRPEVGVLEAYDLTPGLVNSARNILIIPGIMLPWEPHEFGAIYLQAEKILSDVNPDITVVDPLFAPGLTLCQYLDINWIVLAPNTIKDFAVPLQPGLAMLWKYPIVCAALPFPLPIQLIPYNILLVLVAGYMLLTDQRLKRTSQYIHKEISPATNIMTANELGVLKPAPPGLRILAASSPELDYPFTVLPKHVVHCGPIIRAAPSIGSSDPSLEQWLKKGPTVYVNLGTHLKMNVSEAAEMAKAFRDLLSHAQAAGFEEWRKLQILWKLQRKPPADTELEPNDFSGAWSSVCNTLGPEMDADRVRITNWITAEPFSVLDSGHVVCSVHHGGANSFNESICAGVPQVLLPAWADCYDFGNRVEILGVGQWANKKAKPRWEGGELAQSLIETLLGPKAEEIRRRARDLAARFPANTGRERAASEILSAIKTV